LAITPVETLDEVRNIGRELRVYTHCLINALPDKPLALRIARILVQHIERSRPQLPLHALDEIIQQRIQGAVTQTLAALQKEGGKVADNHAPIYWHDIGLALPQANV
jgi:hypothetical protein